MSAGVPKHFSQYALLEFCQRVAGTAQNACHRRQIKLAEGILQFVDMINRFY